MGKQENRYYKNFAIMAVIRKVFSDKTISKKIEEVCNAEDKPVTIKTVSSDSYRYKPKRDIAISENMIKSVIIKALSALVESDLDTITGEIEEKYEFEFSDKYINTDFIDQIFDIKVNPKCIVIDFIDG